MSQRIYYPENGCPSCGGEVKFDRQNRCYQCLFCRKKYPAINDRETPKAKDPELLDPAWFVNDLDMTVLEEKAQASVRKMSHCVDNYHSSDNILDYIRKEFSWDNDLAMPGIHEELLHKVEPFIVPQLEPGEEILLFVDDALLFHGKDGFAITNRRIFFPKKKWTLFLRFPDLRSIGKDDTWWVLNRDSSTVIHSIGADHELQGAAVALICALCFEAEPNREPIRIMNYQI